jgi:hypothetical protein
MGRNLLDEAELDAIEGRCVRASPGPWTAFLSPGLGGPEFIRVSERDAEPDMYVDRDGSPAAAADLDFIAGARQDVPRLLAEVRRPRRLTGPHEDSDPYLGYRESTFPRDSFNVLAWRLVSDQEVQEARRVEAEEADAFRARQRRPE